MWRTFLWLTFWMNRNLLHSVSLKKKNWKTLQYATVWFVWQSLCWLIWLTKLYILLTHSKKALWNSVQFDCMSRVQSPRLYSFFFTFLSYYANAQFFFVHSALPHKFNVLINLWWIMINFNEYCTVTLNSIWRTERGKCDDDQTIWFITNYRNCGFYFCFSCENK